MNCVVCHAESTGDSNPEADTVAEILGVLESGPDMLTRMVEGLCERHRRRVEHIARAWREGTVEPRARQQKGLDRAFFDPPNMTKTQMDAIPSPATGLIVRIGSRWHMWDRGAWVPADDAKQMLKLVQQKGLR